MPPIRFMSCILALLCFTGLAARAETLNGTALYRERIMPPPDARLIVVLADISLADAPETELGRVEIEAAGAPPYDFAIEYDPAEIDPQRTYAVRATLWAGDQMMFTSDTVVPVLTHGAPNVAMIVMQRVAADMAPPTDNAQDAATPLRIGAHGLKLPATFTGNLPCADCEAIAYHLDLWPDQGYHLRREWLGRETDAGANTQDDIGFWFVDPARDAIVLSGLSDTPSDWQVTAPDRIRQLDVDGNVIDSTLPYDLTSDGTLSQTDVEDVFLGGMMRYMADAAVFEECGTGRLYPIVQEGDYLALERAYLADQSAAGAPLYINVEGALIMRPAMEGPEQRSLVVDRFVRTRPGITCERQRADASLTNTYWRIDALAGEAIAGLPADSREPHLILRTQDDSTADAPRFSATVGCNGMMGEFNQRGSALTFGRVAGTLMACPPPLGDLERTLAQTLETVQSYRINGETMVLLDGTNEIIAVLTAVYLK